MGIPMKFLMDLAATWGVRCPLFMAETGRKEPLRLVSVGTWQTVSFSPYRLTQAFEACGNPRDFLEGGMKTRMFVGIIIKLTSASLEYSLLPLVKEVHGIMRHRELVFFSEAEINIPLLSSQSLSARAISIDSFLDLSDLVKLH